MENEIKVQLDRIEKLLVSHTQMLTELVSILNNHNIRLDDFGKNRIASEASTDTINQQGKQMALKSKRKTSKEELDRRLDAFL